MKRPLSIIALVLALAVPAAAAADVVAPKGTLPPPRVEFQAVAVNGKVVKVNKFKFFDVPVFCDEGALLISRGKALPAMGVNKRGRFGATFDFQGAEEVKVKGKITNGGSKAHGSIRVKGNFTEEGVRYANCDSGKVKWAAA